jgi:hypothetical protein
MQKPLFSYLLIGLLAFGIFSCQEKKDDPTPTKTPEELAIQDLTGGSSQAWVVAGGGSVIRDGRSETNIYQTFELVLAANSSSKTYTSINNNDLFDPNGNWSFVTNDLGKIVLTGTKPASGNEISWTQTSDDLILKFTISAPGGRQIPNGAVIGSYTFNLKKKP